MASSRLLLGLLAAFVTLAVGAEELPKYYVVTGENVRLRAEPSLSGTVLGALNKGDLLEYLGRGGGEWVNVKPKAGNAAGWMHEDYFSSWALAGVDEIESRIADIDMADDDHWAVTGQYTPGVPVTLVGASKTAYAKTDKATSSRNECAGITLKETLLKNGDMVKGDKFTVAIVGALEVALCPQEIIHDKAVLASLHQRASQLFKGKVDDFNHVTAEVLLAYAFKAPEGTVEALVLAEPNHTGPVDTRNTHLAIMYGDQAYIGFSGCDAVPTCFSINKKVYFAFERTTCETDDYQMKVFGISKDAIRCIYTSWAFGC